MKKRIFISMVLICFVFLFSIVFLGAGNNNENLYLGTWEGQQDNGYDISIIIYPCHRGEYIDFKGDSHHFSWEIEDGYLLTEGNGSLTSKNGFFSSDGHTMKCIFSDNNTVFIKNNH